MTNYQSRTTYSCLEKEEDILAIENAIWTAIQEVVKVMFNSNRSKIHKYQIMVAERDKENERLRLKMESVERELIALRQMKLSSELSGDAGLEYCKSKIHFDGPHGRAPLPATPLCQEADGLEGPTIEGVAPTPSIIFPFEDPVHPKAEEETRSCSVDTPLVKEEPLDIAYINIKGEACEERLKQEPAAPDSPPPVPEESDVHWGHGALAWPQEGPHPAVWSMGYGHSLQQGDGLTTLTSQRRISNRERQQRYRERIRADPEKQRIYREKDRHRYQKRKKLICDLPEQRQRQKRAAWREAARRHRARKKTPIAQSFRLPQGIEMTVGSAKLLTDC